MFSFPLRSEEQKTFKTTYLGVDYNRNFPQAYGQVFFEPGQAYPGLSYRYSYREKWLVGVKTGFKMLVLKDKMREFPIFSIGQEMLGLERIQHPFYFTYGTQLLFLMPLERAAYPIDRDADFDAEIGVSAQVGLLVQLKDQSFFTIGVTRWRGTKTQRLQGVEVSMGYSYPVN